MDGWDEMIRWMHTWINMMINLLNLSKVFDMSYISLTLIIKEDVILTEDLVEFISQSFYQIDKTSFVYLFIYLFIYLSVCLFIYGFNGCLALHSSWTRFRQSLLRTEFTPLSRLTTLKMVYSGLLQLVCKYYILHVVVLKKSRNFKRL